MDSTSVTHGLEKAKNGTKNWGNNDLISKIWQKRQMGTSISFSKYQVGWMQRRANVLYKLLKTRDVEEMLKEAKESYTLDEGNKTTSDNWFLIKTRQKAMWKFSSAWRK